MNQSPDASLPPVASAPGELLPWHTDFTSAQRIAIAVILTLALLSRFLFLGVRTMDHDEVNHVEPSWRLYTGQGYAHDPITHGPLQFHLLALSYYILGDNDYSSRVPAALFSFAAIAFIIFAFPRYMGRWGAILTALFFLISPYMLFYGRYTRNEGFIELFGVLLLYAVLRHLDRGDRVSLFLFTGATVFHLVTKETAWIYTAQILVFIALAFILEIQRLTGRDTRTFNAFFASLTAAMALLLAAILLAVTMAKPEPAAGVDQPALMASPLFGYEVALVVAALVFTILGLFWLLRRYPWRILRQLRSVNLLILGVTLILPQLTAFPVRMLGWDPLKYTDTPTMVVTGSVLVVLLLLSAAIGLLWNRHEWWKHALFFYVVYVFFYTTMFSNTNGFFTGIIGSLGYWLSQQSVNRGTQPIYYFVLLQMPVYEFLAIAGSLLAVYLGLRKRLLSHFPGSSPASQAIPEVIAPPVEGEPDLPEASVEPEILPPGEKFAEFYSAPRRLPVLFLFIFWGVTSLIAYSLAGEKMPWLTVHVTLGFLFAAGWAAGYVVDTLDWRSVITRPVVYGLLLLPVLISSATGFLGSLLGANPPFSGKTLLQLQATNQFLFSFVFLAGSIAGLVWLLRGVSSQQLRRIFALGGFALLVMLTARAAYRASFIEAENATEFLVYAHASPAPKKVLAEIENISYRITRGKDLSIAYSGDGLYPYWWYMRNYTNVNRFGTTPSRSLRDADVIIAGRDVMSKMAPIVGDRFLKFNYIRLWWPMQSYTNLTWERVRNALTDPQMRQAIWDIWYDRDYRLYAKLTNDSTLTTENWQPSDPMDVYIRKDIAAQIWSYGSAPAPVAETKTDPYEGKVAQIDANLIIGATGNPTVTLNAPRGLAMAADGTLFVADSRNHSIKHLDAEGNLIHAWGSFADLAKGAAPGGTFNEPWGIVVGKNGNVFVTDTWNHRIQQFTPAGEFVSMWGYFGQAENPDGFWGPRALASDGQGRLFGSDTGNKRIVVFDENFTYITQFGSAGLEAGQFDEPVGLAVAANGDVFVADTWNQRIQVFKPNPMGSAYSFDRQWEVNAWFGQSLDNKPFLAISPLSGSLFVADPEGSRVLIFDQQGAFLSGWGDFGNATNAIGLAAGIAIAPDGQVWVSDSANNRLMRFRIP